MRTCRVQPLANSCCPTIALPQNEKTALRRSSRSSNCLSHKAFLRRRPSKARPTRAEANSGRAPGSGTADGTPVTLMPAVVPNENVALVMVVLGVMPKSEITNIAVWLRNGLCAGFPAIEPLALLYVPPLPGGPKMRCVGPAAPAPRSFNRSVFDVGELRTQPAGTVAPVEKVPLDATVIA
jgi:hypothetical protein